jgi:hypothetical protein
VDIQAASIDQVQRGRDGKVHVVTSDAGDVAKQIREIDRSFVLRYHEHTDHWSVVQVLPDGGEQLVTTCQPVAGTVDPRLPERVRKITQPSYDVVGEITRSNDALHARNEREFSDRVDERAEVLEYAVRRELGIKDRIFVPGRGAA